MIEKIFERFGYVPELHVRRLEVACDALAGALAKTQADLDTEVTYSADGRATALDEITAQVPVVLARHA